MNIFHLSKIKIYLYATPDASIGELSRLKYDLDGKLIWAKQLSDYYYDASGLAIDQDNNIWISVRYLATRAAIVKYNKDGDLILEKNIFSANLRTVISRVTAISINDNNEVVICGSYRPSEDSVQVDDVTIEGDLAFRYNGFVSKHDSQGKAKWFKTTESAYECIFRDLSEDINGNITAIGDFITSPSQDSYDSLIIGNNELESTKDPNDPYNAGRDVVIVNYSSLGSLNWVQSLGGIEEDWGNKVSVSKEGKIGIIGTFTDAANIDGIELLSYGGYDIYFGLLGPNGDVLWFKNAGSDNQGFGLGFVEAGRSIVHDSDGNIYISGTFASYARFPGIEEPEILSSEGTYTQQGFIGKYSNTGELVWINGMIGGRSAIYDISVNESQIYIAGEFYSETLLMEHSLPATYLETNNFFLASINDKGLVTSLNDHNNSDVVRIYPNPAVNSIDIFLDDSSHMRKKEILIIDSKGSKVLKTTSLKSSMRIDISKYRNGVYAIVINDGSNISTHKFIKY